MPVKFESKNIFYENPFEIICWKMATINSSFILLISLAKLWMHMIFEL